MGEGRARNDGRARLCVGKRLRLRTYQWMELCAIHGRRPGPRLLERSVTVRVSTHGRQRLGVV